jgi:hypothetical protein
LQTLSDAAQLLLLYIAKLLLKLETFATSGLQQALMLAVDAAPAAAAALSLSGGGSWYCSTRFVPFVNVTA